MDVGLEAVVVQQVEWGRNGTLSPGRSVTPVGVVFKEANVIGPYPWAVVTVETLYRRDGLCKGMLPRIARFSPKGEITSSVNAVVGIVDVAGSTSESSIKAFLLWRNPCQMAVKTASFEKIVHKLGRCGRVVCRAGQGL
jgi:hypothetical protein